MWTEHDVDMAVPMVGRARERFLELSVRSFDRGFHSPANRRRLDGILEADALPRKGRLSKPDIARESDGAFRAARRQRPAVESAINSLERRGLDRVRSHGREGFARTVALAVLSLDFHRVGLLVRERERRRKRLPAAA